MAECKEVGCNGNVAEKASFTIRVGCFCSEETFACKKCGRLHYSSGNLVFNRDGERAFLTEDNLIVLR